MSEKRKITVSFGDPVVIDGREYILTDAPNHYAEFTATDIDSDKSRIIRTERAIPSINWGSLDRERDTIYADLLRKHIESLYRAKKRIFKERLEELGSSIDWEAEGRRTFKKVGIIDAGEIRQAFKDYSGETWIYNDGSEAGRPVVTFLNSINGPGFADNETVFTVEFKYQFH